MDASASHAEAAAPVPSVADRELRNACLALVPGVQDLLLDRFTGLFFLVVDRTAAQRGVSITPAEREALVAEILLEIFRDDAAALRAYTLRSSLASYLTVLARRVVVRSLLLRLETVPTEHPQPPPTDMAAGEPAAEELEPAPDLLAADEIRLLKLYHRDRKSYGEIGRIMGLPLGAIGPALARARAKLRHANERGE